MTESKPHDQRDVLQIPSAGSAWVVLHSRPRCEKKVVRVCEEQQVDSYLPLRQRVHRYGRRERAFSSPLFPGYVFCAATDQQASFMRQNRYVANLLRVVDQDKLVHQLRQIRQALEVGDDVEVMPFLETGKLVRVTGGAFKGLEGIVLRAKGKARVVINVDMIQQSVAVEVETAYLGPA